MDLKITLSGLCLLFIHPRAPNLISLRVWSKYSNAQRVSSLHVYRHHEGNHPGKENLLLFPASNLSLP